MQNLVRMREMKRGSEMHNEIEAAGAAMHAGLAAGVLEGREARRPVHGPCANCGAQTVGAYCHACGQPAHVHRTLGHMIAEFAHGIWHFDSKAWRTLPYLIFRPGTLTRDYVYGKRARFISPLALFLFSIFLMFFAFSLIRVPPVSAPPGRTIAEARIEQAQLETELAGARTASRAAQARLDTADAQEAQARLASDGAQLEAALREVEGARIAFAQSQSSENATQKRLGDVQAQLSKSARNLAILKSSRADLGQRIAAAESAGEGVRAAALRAALAKVDRALAAMESGEAPLASTSEPGIDINGEDVAVNLGLGQQQAQSSILEEIKRAEAAGKIDVHTGNKNWDKKVHEKLANPELGWYKIQNTAYKFSFLLVPISLPFVWLIFAWKRGITLFDHTVFILYSLTAASLLSILLLGINTLPWNMENLSAALVFIGGGLHIFFHVKGAYALGWFGAAWRALYLMITSVVCVVIFVAIIVILGLTG